MCHLYNITNLAFSQEKNISYEIITNNKVDIVLQRIEERINLRDSLLPYIKKAIDSLHEKYGKNDVIFERIKECGKNIWIDDKNGKIGTANFCKNRLCPVCNYRRSSKQWGLIYKIVLNHNDKYKYLFITLTVENCTTENLSKTIDDILESFHRLTSRKKWKRVIKGYVRGLEITYNSNLNSFHPHLHILCAVDKDYFTEPDKYFSATEITENWKKSANLNYRPSTDIRAVDDNKKAVAEIAKYSLKMANILTSGTINSKRAKAVKTLYESIYSRRLISMAGCFKSKLLKSDINEIELDDFENKRKIIELIKAENRANYAEYLHNLTAFRFNDSTGNFDKLKKVNFKE